MLRKIPCYKLLLFIFLIVGCVTDTTEPEDTTETEDVYGCTDATACNFNTDIYANWVIRKEELERWV